MNEQKNTKHVFKYVYWTFPIDFWSGACVAEDDIAEAVLDQMPEAPRNGAVYKLMLPNPGDPSLCPIYLCKADNNGTIYIFSDWNILEAFSDLYERG